MSDLDVPHEGVAAAAARLALLDAPETQEALRRAAELCGREAVGCKYCPGNTKYDTWGNRYYDVAAALRSLLLGDS